MDCGLTTKQFIDISEKVDWREFILDLMGLRLFPKAVACIRYFNLYDHQELVMDVWRGDGVACRIRVYKRDATTVVLSLAESWPSHPTSETYMNVMSQTIEWLLQSRKYRAA